MSFFKPMPRSRQIALRLRSPSVRRLAAGSLAAILAACTESPPTSPDAALSRSASPAGPVQFLTLPLHPRKIDAEEAEGIGEEQEGHFIWHAPFLNGQPPGHTRGNAPGGGGGGTQAAPSTGGLDVGKDGDVSNAPDSYQGETGGASNGSVIVAGSNSIFPGNCSTLPCAVRAYTSANGTDWSSTTLSRNWGGATFGITFDPALDSDTDGNFYFVFGGAPLSGSYPNSIAVSKAGPSGTAWGAPVPVTFNKNRFFDDKYYLAVDRSAGAFRNRIYVSWDRNTSTDQILYVSYSSDRGATWSDPVKVDDGTSNFERVIFAYPAVDQTSGVVYDAWHNYARGVIYVDRSTTGGATWGTDVAAAVTHTGFGMNIGCVGGRSQGPAHHLKVGPSGTLHLVYADNTANRGFDILYTRSTNGGQSWSAPVVLDDDAGGAHQFHPTLAVTDNGSGGDRVTVSFMDRRDDPANCSSHVYATASADGGLTWSANVKVTKASSNYNGNPNGPGDYSSSTPSTLGVFPFFGDHRTSDFEIFTAALQAKH
jgi:hypothetical protein